MTEIRKALIEHCCVFLRGQEGMTDLDQARFAGYFGSFGRDPFVEGEETHPSVLKVAKEADEGRNPTFGGNWHSDWSFLETPPAFTFLHARERRPMAATRCSPTSTSPTRHCRRACARRSTACARCTGRRRMRRRAFYDNTNARSMKVRHDERAMGEMVHPVVRVHPESGRRALFANVAYTVRFEGMTERESLPLLNFLYEHAVKPEFVCRFTWSPGAMAIWDNRCLVHFAINDYSGYRRELRRTTVRGEKPIPVGADSNLRAAE